MTETYRRLRVAERFGQRPQWADALGPGMLALLLAYDEVRQEQEAARP